MSRPNGPPLLDATLDRERVRRRIGLTPGGRRAGARRGAAVVLVLPLAGCLFTDSINHAPRAELRVVEPTPSAPPLIKGGWVELDPTASSDPDEGHRGRLLYHWFVNDVPAGNKSDQFEAKPNPSRPGSIRIQLTKARAYVVSLVVEDPEHALSFPATTSFTVRNAAPTDVAFQLSEAPNGCGDHTAGATLHLTGSANDADVMYDDAGLTFQWTVKPPLTSTAAYLGECGAPPRSSPGGTLVHPTPRGTQAAKLACLQPDVPGAYEVFLKVSDGAAEVEALPPQFSRVLVVASDRPACLLGTERPPGTYLLARSAPVELRVTQVLDDLDAYPPVGGTRPRLTWSVWREQDPVWRVRPGVEEEAFLVDPTRYAVDELVRVRVWARDRVDRNPPSCDPTSDTCALGRDFPPESICHRFKDDCQSWVTWNLRFR